MPPHCFVCMKEQKFHDDIDAVQFLESRYYWVDMVELEIRTAIPGEEPTAQELAAINYLRTAWDYKYEQ